MFVSFFPQIGTFYKYMPLTRKSASCAYALLPCRRTLLPTARILQPIRTASAAAITTPVI